MQAPDPAEQKPPRVGEGPQDKAMAFVFRVTPSLVSDVSRQQGLFIFSRGRGGSLILKTRGQGHEAPTSQDETGDWELGFHLCSQLPGLPQTHPQPYPCEPWKQVGRQCSLVSG